MHAMTYEEQHAHTDWFLQLSLAPRLASLARKISRSPMSEEEMLKDWTRRRANGEKVADSRPFNYWLHHVRSTNAIILERRKWTAEEGLERIVLDNEDLMFLAVIIIFYNEVTYCPEDLSDITLDGQRGRWMVSASHQRDTYHLAAQKLKPIVEEDDEATRMARMALEMMKGGTS